MSLHLPVRCSAGRAASNLLRLAALLALVIAVRPVSGEESVPADHPAATAKGASITDGKTKPEQQSANKKAASGEEIDRSIAALASDDYHTREEAVKRLKSLGPAAIDALAKAAESHDLEVSYRAVRVLQTLLEHTDLNTQQQAVDVLESLSDGESASADLATDALAVYHLTQQDRALSALRQLGAKVSEVNFGDDLQITLDEKWRGKTDDLALLKQVPRLNHLRILYVKLDDQAIKILSELTQLGSPDTFGTLDLFGTGVSEQDAAALTQALPGTKIDRRNGAMLGVGPPVATATCTIGQVVENSAAWNADFRIEDEIVSIDGQPVQHFEEITTLIGAKSPGDSVMIDLRRNGQTLTKQVVLGKWPE
jgi:hypothetical protein